MSYISLLTQTYTYWAPSTNNGFSEFSYASPTTGLCRWQDINDTFEDTDGQEFVSDAIVYTTTELANNGWLYLGTSAQTNPQNQEGAYRIRRRLKSQTPSADIIVYKNICG